jgi:hypothetical protein
MKVFAVWLVLVLGLATGCAGDREDKGLSLRRIEPPTFLNGDLAALFGQKTFTARAELTSRGTTTIGDLTARNGSLFLRAGEVLALWDASQQKAFLFNEPLQAYAPMRSSTNEAVVLATEGGLPTKIQMAEGGRVTILTLTKIRPNVANTEDFGIPAGFKAYATADAMLAELDLRRRDLMSAKEKARAEKYGSARAVEDPSKVQPPPHY